MAYFPKIIMGRGAGTHERLCNAGDTLIAALICNALASGPMHGYAISESIGEFSEGLLPIPEADLYAALHRLEFHGDLISEWGIGEDHQRAKYYRLREARAFRSELVLEILALMLVVGTASRGAPPANDGGSCIGVTVPVSFSGRIGSVRVSVNGAPATFVIDTASDTIINSDRLQLFVLHTLTANTVTTSGAAPVEWNLVRIGRFTIGGTEIRKRTALAKGLGELEAALGREVDGILGNDVLNEWDSITLDYKNRALALGCSSDEDRYER
ncbi:MAG: helix-turn-helix transcriptional regulator [Bryobacteraceae bacterium]